MILLEKFPSKFDEPKIRHVEIHGEANLLITGILGAQ